MSPMARPLLVLDVRDGEDVKWNPIVELCHDGQVSVSFLMQIKGRATISNH